MIEIVERTKTDSGIIIPNDKTSNEGIVTALGPHAFPIDPLRKELVGKHVLCLRWSGYAIDDFSDSPKTEHHLVLVDDTDILAVEDAAPELVHAELDAVAA